MGESSIKASSLRWRILRNALIRNPPDNQSEANIKQISRKATHGFNLIPYHLLQQNPNPSESPSQQDVCLCHTIPITTGGARELHLYQRADECTSIATDFEICNRYNIDNTGLVCRWPSEDVLAYYCLSHADTFKSKAVIELGSGYGLAGLVIAAFTHASQVVISDGNPQVVDYIQRNIDANCGEFGDNKVVKSVALHWGEDHGRDTEHLSDSFDVIVASDCTFFKEFHRGLVRTVKSLLKKDSGSRALFFSPKRGDSLEKFLAEATSSGMSFVVTEIYDAEIWKRHEKFVEGSDDWPNYEKDHCYPLLVTVTL